MSARENVLARIRARQGKPAAPSEAEREAVRSYLAAPPRHPRPREERDLLARFRERAVALASTVDEVASLEEVPAAVARYLAAHTLPHQAVCWPALAALDWRGAGIEVSARAAREGDLVGITGAFCAIAETGTLMTVSGPDTPPTVSLLPETHIAVLAASRIVRGMEEAWQLAREELELLPRAVNFISGPSRSADIEQTVTLGAHGPYRVHVVLVERAAKTIQFAPAPAPQV
jgi:L-lactate dehydrogenase complex protein LldG